MGEKKEIKSEDYYKRFTAEELWVMRLRCLVSGCQYGVEGLDKEPKERCIWCGEKRIVGHFEGVNIPDLVEEYSKSKLTTK